jgi:DNA-binding GntR family transcriptional regulator
MAAAIRSNSALHESVREELAGRIDRGVYALDEPLPSTTALADEFRVSAITIKRAVRDLQTAGLLRSTPGLGTFVREQHRFIRDLDASFTSVEDLEKSGQKASIQLLSIARRHIDQKTFAPLSPPSGYMLNVQKLIAVDGLVITYDSAFITSSLDDRLLKEFGHKFIYEALNEHGLPVIHTHVVIDAAPASPEVQQAFSVPNGYPTLRRLYRFKTIDPNVSVFGLAEAPFDRFACTIERSRTP